MSVTIWKKMEWKCMVTETQHGWTFILGELSLFISNSWSQGSCALLFQECLEDRLAFVFLSIQKENIYKLRHKFSLAHTPISWFVIWFLWLRKWKCCKNVLFLYNIPFSLKQQTCVLFSISKSYLLLIILQISAINITDDVSRGINIYIYIYTQYLTEVSSTLTFL